MSNSDIRKIAAFTPIAWAFIVFLYTPLLSLVIFSFNTGRSVTVWQGFSIEWYQRLLANDSLLQALQNSLLIALVSAGIGTVLSLFAAIAFVRGPDFKGKQRIFGFLSLPLMVPEIVTAVATLSFFSFLDLKLGLLNIIIAHTVFCIPFSFMPILGRITGLNDELEQAASDLYAKPVQVFILITVPLLLPGIIAGFMMAFVVSMDDFIITLMISQAGSTTLPVYIYSMVKVGLTPEVNAVSSVVLLFSVMMVLLSRFIQKK